MITLSLCFIFKKANEHWWLALIPFANVYTLYKIVRGNGWKFLLLLIPIFGQIYAIITQFKLAKAFGKGVGFGLGLFLLCPIFMLILAFDQSKYEGAVE
ncbi:MAG: hypothetical protein H6687_01850 [Bacillales bacterium]|nr:hypothetical protein [Bacillales bacterium]